MRIKKSKFEQKLDEINTKKEPQESNDGYYDFMSNILEPILDSILSFTRILSAKKLIKEVALMKEKFRVGRKQHRVILDEKGHVVAVFEKGHEKTAKLCCELLNKASVNQHK